MMHTTTSSPRARLWRAHIHCARSGRGLIRCQVNAPDLRTAESTAIATAGLTLRLGPSEITVPKLHQIA